jgi:two-component system chemotaxis sensor kinase CheA
MSLSNQNATWQKRAEAAEKTVAVLKTKVIELYNSGAQSVIHRQLDKARQREDENRRKRELMEVRNQELKKYSETLEDQVASRTEAIKTILNHVMFGFLVVDRQLTIDEEYTQSCHELFGQQELAARNLMEVLGLNKREREHYLLCVDQVFEDLLPSSVSLGQFPQRFEVNGRILLVEGSVIRKEGVVNRILYTVSDTSKLEAAQKEALANRVLVGVLRRKEAFHEFMCEVKEQIGQCRVTVAQDQFATRRTLHTLKGNAASWELYDIAVIIHSIEDEPTITSSMINAVEDQFRSFVNHNGTVFGFSYDSLHELYYEVSNTQLTRLKTIISDLQGFQADMLQRWTADVLQKPAAVLLGPLEEFAEKLSERLGKPVEFKVKGLDTLVDVDSMRGVLQSVLHLVRNSVDHGIEEDRESTGKPAVGQVEFTLQRTDTHYVVSVADDGRGIDFEKLKKKALQLGLKTVQEIAELTPQEELDLVFLDGLSSADTTTDISGRGVGMSSILSAVRRANGRFYMTSTFGVGSTMRLEIPVPEVLRKPLKEAA